MSKLCNQAHKLLEDRPRHVTLKQIEQATGLRVQWLQDFVSGRTDDPGVKKVEKLYVHLSGKELIF